MGRENAKRYWIPLIFLLSSITLIWAFKTFYFVGELGLNPHKKYILLSSGGLSLLTAGLLLSKKRKLFFYITGIFYFLLSFLLYADVVYERYYDSILSVQLMDQAGQLGDVKDSILSLLYRTDYLYWIDVPFVLAILFFSSKRISFDRTKPHPLFLVSGGFAVLLFTSFFPLKETFSDQYMVSLTGIVPAHIYQTTHTFYVNTLASSNSATGEYERNELRDKFSQNQEIQKKSPYFGKYKGKNIIIVQAESLNTFPIGLSIEGKKVTPVMDELIKGSHYYPNSFTQIGRGNTSDAEFVANNSIYPMAPKGVYKGFPNNDYLSLPNVLKEIGYKVSATHGNSPEFWNRQQAYKKQGFTSFYHIDHPKIKKDELIGLGLSDESMFDQMAEIYKEEKKPFYNFIITLTNHRPFEMPSKYQYLKLPDEFKGTATGNYLQSVHYFDTVLGKFIDQLKAEGIWDESIFVLYGDHYGPIPKDEAEIKQLLGITFNEKERLRIPIIIHYPGETEGVADSRVSSQMDIYPTLTSVLGIEQPLVQFGMPLYASGQGFAGFAYETTRYSFYSDNYDYKAAHNGAFEAGTCYDNFAGKQVDVEFCRKGYDKLVNDIELSTKLLENNLIRDLFKK
ncbi:LTA synthase family protein [Neobacillus notoginsengisoli]|uniref:LTA synthase family protein n=1 Tax=Neobacillus notoginsengisoli TaxID=1578198 RepID=A0A417YQX6_9BACI|nr:LTA synthase family protein [Neobacillus notoginsengisoli]RHW37261.1 LTA synthase family protein [Neobacillus notoginsengisoli]